MSDEHRNPITLTRFLLQERSQFKQATGSFAMLLQSIQLACKVIANANSQAGIANLYGIAGTENKSGDAQKKMDVFSNDVFINCLRFSDQVYLMGSEENEEAIVCDETGGGYAVVFDPLDGSSNIDANIAVGTIFGIYKKKSSTDRASGIKDLLRPGSELIAAGYCLYSTATMIVLTTGLGVNGFVLDPTIGEFILTHPCMRIPDKGKIYSINEGNAQYFDHPTTAWIEHCKAKKKKARYIGSMVGDVHRTLLYGGIFAYPGDSKNKNGKLRILYEGNPMAMIVEQAGGMASTGHGRILDEPVTGIHQRIPVWMGSKEDVKEVLSFYNGTPPSSAL